MSAVTRKRSHADMDPQASDEPVATKRRLGSCERVSGTLIVQPESKDEKACSKVEWSTRFGSSCLFGTCNGPLPKAKRVILFDLDSTLITTVNGVPYSRNEKNWRWMYPQIPAKLERLAKEGYAIFVVSNQLYHNKHQNKEEYYIPFKNKLARVARDIPTVPFRVLAATATDVYRKPLPGMWYAVKKLCEESDIPVNMNEIIFVGNAAGRSKDHSDTDRKFGDNIKAQFQVPEQYFLGETSTLPVRVRGWHPNQLPHDGPLYLPSNKPLVPLTKPKPVIVMFVGWPAIGKTTAYKKHYEPLGFVRVNEKELGGRSNCMQAIENAVRAKKSVVIDDTNEDVSTRRDYISLARDEKVQMHCLYFEGGEPLARHNNIYRAHCMENNDIQKLLPSKSWDTYRTTFSMPQKDEGFKEIKRLYFRFDGSDEDRERYMMWLELS